MATSFKREVKMKTTEPSVDEVGGGMKKGGHAKHKMHKADGGMPMMSRPAPALMRQRPMVRPPAAPIMRKVGGMAKGGETKESHKAEMHELKAIKSELKHHEHEKASKAHHGLKKGGGVERAVPGGLLPGVTKAHGKGMTGGVREPGYKKGGHAKHHLKAGGSVIPYENTKMHDDEHGNAVKKKTSGGIEGVGYKKGGHAGKKHHYAKGGNVSAYANTKMHDDEHGNAVKKKGTGDIELSKFKDGGHVAHHKHEKKHHADGGHMHMHSHSAKHHDHGGHTHMHQHEVSHKHGGMHHTTKMSTHKKKGGMCNY